jgi:2-polyprenyl-3-methyl-5-hydroxy-6-metoxy-1,4-benzoquinol methylase
MTQINKYERLYQEHSACCGEPFPEIASFFETYEKPGAKVLDLGCGQGRDALLIARHGHCVLGIDISETGIRQMTEAATAEGLDVRGMVADIVEIALAETFDVVVLDRVLHMLPLRVRVETLKQMLPYVAANGTILIADMPSNKPAVKEAFVKNECLWEPILDRKGFLFLRKSDKL